MSGKQAVWRAFVFDQCIAFDALATSGWRHRSTPSCLRCRE
jgi:hypothetical protein